MNKILTYVFLFYSIFTIAQEVDSTKTKLADSTKTKLKVFGSFESNGQWYTNDKHREIQHDSIPLRSNNYLNLNANYGRFTVGTQIEVYDNEALLNFNPEFRKTNLGTYYANYKSTKLDVTLGHFYEQFGSGLALRTREDRALGINNAIRGARIKYSPIDAVTLTGLYGRQRTGFNVSKGDILGFNLDSQISSLFKISSFDLNYGFSFVSRTEDLPSNITNLSNTTNVISNRLDFSKKAFYFNSEYVIKSEDAIYNIGNINYDFVKPGNALLLNFGYVKKGFGIDATFRRMENMLFLSERKPTAYPDPVTPSTSLNYNDKILNFIPSLTKQHHSNLANIYVYQAQSQVVMNESTLTNKFGEIGGQIDLFYDFKKGTSLGGKYGTKISLNVSNWYNLKAKYRYYDNNGADDLGYTTDFLGSKEKYFSDYNIEISKKISPKFKTALTYINQYYNNQQIQSVFQEFLIRTNILFSESTIVLNNSKSIVFGLEHMWADNDRKNWMAGNIEYNHNKNWSVFAMDMYNYGFDENSQLINHGTDAFQIHFYNFGTAFKKGSTRIALNYGRQRGGLVCAGGVCRFVPPSTGLGLQISTSF